MNRRKQKLDMGLSLATEKWDIPAHLPHIFYCQESLKENDNGKKKETKTKKI